MTLNWGMGDIKRPGHGAGPHPPEPSVSTPGRPEGGASSMCFLFMPLLEGPQVPGTD